ncbi:hypothetical protein [Spiroplasma clarkii]|nr:hypothetical protein [Spiroplasma clarkii]
MFDPNFVAIIMGYELVLLLVCIGSNALLFYWITKTFKTKSYSVVKAAGLATSSFFAIILFFAIFVNILAISTNYFHNLSVWAALLLPSTIIGLIGGIFMIKNAGVVYSESCPEVNVSSELRTIVYLNNIIYTCFLACFIIPLLWVIPMLIYTKRNINSDKDHIVFGVCMIIFLNIFSGILYLISMKYPEV